jgi:hypothetical protein
MTSSSMTLSAALPPMIECVPHELLPIIPPNVHLLCVAGSTAQVRPCGAAAVRSSSQMTPGSTRAVRRSGSKLTIFRMYLEKSNMTAALTLCPDRPVPQPRASTGTSCSRHTRSALTTSLACFGSTTPIGTCR